MVGAYSITLFKQKSIVSMSRMRWGDTLDDEEEELIPEGEVRGPDKDGVKTVIDYYKNNKGQIIKRTRRIRVIKVEKTVYKAAEERRTLPKFGDAQNEDNEAATMQNPEEIYFERTNIPKQSKEQNKLNADISNLMKLGSNSAVNQGIGEFLKQRKMEREQGAGGRPAAIPEEEPASAGPSKGGYVAPHRREGAAATMGDRGQDPRRRDENSVRVTNLSEFVTEDDLRELFKPFGHIGRVYIAKDKVTGISRGFAFINFSRREDAQNAIDTLDGYGYDNLIMSVQWAQPRS
eukprot:TRINITY_DN955_c0_g1_i4.p1 TRINITY_DN955_c0_g1~~TRINITY_DN955_c0_g1_i4.p1  ORF type:complete len:306 (-),score=30.97 TRINITY_DN955_c0_g1_i4:448-1320(-)